MPTADKALKLAGRIERARFSDSVYEMLLEAVRSGRLASGSVVSEVSLAKQFEIAALHVRVLTHVSEWQAYFVDHFSR